MFIPDGSGKHETLRVSHISQYHSPLFLLWGQPSVPTFEKGGSQKKNECLGGLKESLPQVFVRGEGGGLLCFLAKKTL